MPRDDVAALRWHRSAELIHNVLPRGMRTLFRCAFLERYGQPWVDTPEYGHFFTHGGVAPWTDFTQLLTATVDWNRSGARPMKILKVAEDLSALLKKGDVVRLGACGYPTCFFTVLAKDPSPPNPHRGYGELEIEAGVPLALDAQQKALHVYGSSGNLPSFAPPMMANSKPLKLEQHVRSRIESGLLEECDVTALNVILVGVSPPAPVTPGASTSSGARTLLKSVLKFGKDAVKNQALVDAANAKKELLPGDVVKVVVMVRNTSGAHVANTKLDEAGQ